jgi:hypothetical protein
VVLQGDDQLVTLCYMAVTLLQSVAEREQCFRQIEKLVNSTVLHGSESLCKLLRYLAEHTLNHPGKPVKEYQIATEVFGRPADFDPHLDSAIRVQVGRLRVKLAEYYQSEGREDPLYVELPKGTYLLTFRPRVPVVAKTSKAPEESAVREASVRPLSRGWMIVIGALSILLIAAVAVISGLLVNRNTARASLGADEPGLETFQRLWKPFLSGPEEPWVIFSNGAFIGRPETGLRYFDARHDSRERILDHYTGVGEVLGVHELDYLFDSLQQRIRIKRGSLLSLDDAKNNNLIFVGSPAENLTLLDIPGTQEFIFQRPSSGPRRGDLAIVNVHPQPGEASAFFGTPSGVPLIEDYAVIALAPGVNPERSIMILAGTTTIGTQAAVEYVCRQDSVAELLRRLGVSKAGELTPFEALLRVKVARGVPVETKIVAVRKRMR